MELGEVSACVVIYSAIIFNEGEGLAPLPFDPIIRTLQNPKLYRLASLLDRLICWERRGGNDLKRGAVLRNLRQVTAAFRGSGANARGRRRGARWAHLKLLSGEISSLPKCALPFCVAAHRQATLIAAAHPFNHTHI